MRLNTAQRVRLHDVLAIGVPRDTKHPRVVHYNPGAARTELRSLCPSRWIGWPVATKVVELVTCRRCAALLLAEVKV